ncbi:MAG: ribokinase [Chloroflexi bacterium]|nr:ribokinase [Chloroflexota bacterium]
MQTRNRVLVLGSLNMDLVVGSERVPLSGETIFGRSFATFLGGKGANQAVAAARLGVPVGMVGAVGGDAFGAQLADTMAQEGIDTSALQRTEGVSTGIALVMVEPGGRNTMIVVPGANGEVAPDAALASLDQLAPIRLLVAQFEIRMDTTWQVIHAAQARGIPVLLNAAPARAEAPAYFRGLDYLVVNEQEAACLAEQSVDNPALAAQAAHKLAGWGVLVVIVTLGVQGAVVVANGISQHIPAVPVEAVDSTAAGDAYIGGLAWALTEGQPLERAMTVAGCCGALAVTRLGAQPSLPTRTMLEAFMRERHI